MINNAPVKESANLIIHAYEESELPSSYTVVETLKIKILSAHETIGFICRRDDVVFVVFRGTETIYDWVINSEIKPDVVTDIHGGFWSLAKQLLPIVQSAIIRLGNCQVYFTGHSLGGSLATIIGNLVDCQEKIGRAHV